MRVGQHKPPHHEKPAAEPKKEEDGEEDQEEMGTDVDKKSKEKLIVSGVVTKVLIKLLV